MPRPFLTMQLGENASSGEQSFLSTDMDASTTEPSLGAAAANAMRSLRGHSRVQHWTWDSIRPAAAAAAAAACDSMGLRQHGLAADKQSH